MIRLLFSVIFAFLFFACQTQPPRAELLSFNDITLVQFDDQGHHQLALTAAKLTFKTSTEPFDFDDVVVTMPAKKFSAAHLNFNSKEQVASADRATLTSADANFLLEGKVLVFLEAGRLEAKTAIYQNAKLSLKGHQLVLNLANEQFSFTDGVNGDFSQ